MPGWYNQVLPSKAALSNWQLTKMVVFWTQGNYFQVIWSQIISDVKCQKFCLMKRKIQCGTGGCAQTDLLSSGPKGSCAALENRADGPEGILTTEANFTRGITVTVLDKNKEVLVLQSWGG